MPDEFDQEAFRSALARLGRQASGEAIGLRRNVWRPKSFGRPQQAAEMPQSSEIRAGKLTALLLNPNISGLEFEQEGTEAAAGQPKNLSPQVPWDSETSHAVLATVESLELQPLQRIVERLNGFVELLQTAVSRISEDSRIVDNLLDAEDARIASISARPPSPSDPSAARVSERRAARQVAVAARTRIRSLLTSLDTTSRDLERAAQELDADATELWNCRVIASAAAAAREIARPTATGALSVSPLPVASALEKLQSSVRDIDRLLDAQ
jgi:hypothetical protein